MLPRLYAILDIDLTQTRGLDPRCVLDQWLDAGVRLVQLRAKTWTFGPFLELAERLSTACREAGAIFIVNDRIDVARLSGADGVHLGQDDLSPTDAVRVLGSKSWIGLSTHTDPQVVAALTTSATYLATGPVFGTSTKANADPVIGLAGVERAAALAHSAGRPLVAIGGIDLGNARDVLMAGADSVAVISSLLEGDDRAGRVRAFLQVVGEPRTDG